MSDFLPHSPHTDVPQLQTVTPKSSATQLLKMPQTHNMTMRYKNQTVMYKDTEDTPTPHDTTPLENTPPTHSTLEQDGETTTEYTKYPNSQRDLVELQEHFQQFQEQLTQLVPTANPPAHAEEVAHLTNKLQQPEKFERIHDRCTLSTMSYK